MARFFTFVALVLAFSRPAQAQTPEGSSETREAHQAPDARAFRNLVRSPSAAAPMREEGLATRETEPPVDSVIVEVAFAFETVGDARLRRERRNEAMSQSARGLRQEAMVEMQSELLRSIRLNPVGAVTAE